MSAEKSLELDVIKEQVKQYCSFSLGIRRIEETEPSFDPLIIRRDHGYMKNALEAVIRYGTMPFAGIRDLSDTLNSALKGRTLTAAELLNVLQMIRGIRGIHSYMKSLDDVDVSALKDLTGTLILHEKCEKQIARCINEYAEVMDSASSELASVRMSLRRCDADIAAAAQRFVTAHKDSVVDGIITNRNGRTVVLVRTSDKNTFGGMVYGSSSSGQAAYIEPAALVGPNNRKQELKERELEEIQRILRICSEAVSLCAREELANLEMCAILDAVFAKAQWGAARDAVPAELTEEKKIELIKARHPLIKADQVVANDYRIADPKRTLLITGPNTGGKTVSMKVIGLFTLMTYYGMPVTAESAVIPYFDRLFVDIGDDQSVVSSLSSFSAHIEKQAEVCREATEDSLVLLDEVGNGTDPREGEALAISILNELRQRRCMTVATTHYGRLKAYGKRHEDIQVASVQFDMKKLMPTYRYIEGMTGQSNAFEVAQRYGLPAGIIKYARHLKDQAKTQEDLLIERLEQQLNETEQKNAELNALIEENTREKERIRKESLQLQKDRDEWKMKAEAEAQEYIEETRRKADEVLADLRKKQQDVKYHEMIEKRHELDTITPEEEPEDDAPVYEYHVGDAVEVRGSKNVCEVLKVGKKDITIDFNGRQMRVKPEQLRPSTHIIPKMKKKITADISIRSADMFASMPLECNLIGMRVDEAMEEMDDYMGQAKLHGLKQFRIIHGDGTGRLRKAVHDSLKNDSSVKEYRLGMPHEGGTGATVVILK